MRNDEIYGKDKWTLPNNYNHYYFVGVVIDEAEEINGSQALIIEIKAFNNDRIGIKRKEYLQYQQLSFLNIMR